MGNIIMLNKADFIVIISFVLLAIASYFVINNTTNETVKTAVIYKDNKEVASILLTSQNEGKVINIDGKYPLKAVVKDGKIGVEDATCPDKLCVKQGFIGRNGEMIVCLPNDTYIKVEGSTKDDIIMPNHD